MHRAVKCGAWVCAVAAAALMVATLHAMAPVSQLFAHTDNTADTLQAFDRNGTALSYHYHARWNHDDVLPLHAFPPLLVQAMLHSEDKRFYAHHGVDWRARGSAFVTNLIQGKRVRGASSITEQVVRMLHPRPRTLWSKWVEGFDAMRLESAISKEALLEFYLNQVPYGSGRRGVVQAARFYFGRDIDTLSTKEMLALVVLVRAPSSYDLYRHKGRIEGAVTRLATAILPNDAHAAFATQPLTLGLAEPPVDASHFLRYVRMQSMAPHTSRLTTTLDAALQQQVQHILDQRVAQLASKHVGHGGALVVDHHTREVLAWVVAGEATDIDIITTARQPGSAMKPFLYASALMKGWTAATPLDDSPLREAIGTGMHRFRNYSHRYHGTVSLREALGNSLNIPALLTIRHVTPDSYLSTLHALGFTSLDANAERYDEGLALGAGEVTPLELAAAYSTLARGGSAAALRVFLHEDRHTGDRPVFTPEVSAIIGDILSDPWARVREFGRASVLSLPVQTAIKTGTSTDYRDAWAAGYNHRYTVVVWMGNLDGSPMDGVTGSTGPALALRSIFSELTRNQHTAKLSMPRTLERHAVCIDVSASPPCATREEYFIRGSYHAVNAPKVQVPLELVQPTDRLRIAYDPRIPAALQSFRFMVRGVAPGARVRWTLNGAALADDEALYYDWPVERGRYRLQVSITDTAGQETALPTVRFSVK